MADERDESDDIQEEPRSPRPRPPREEDLDEPLPPRRRRRRNLEEAYLTKENWLDQQFLNTPMVVLVIFPLCCGMVALALGIAGLVGCTHPVAKQRATIVLVISVIWIIVATVAQFARMAAQ